MRMNSGYWLNVFIDGIPEDRADENGAKISGLCGNFNGNENDDLVNLNTGAICTGESSQLAAPCYQTHKYVYFSADENSPHVSSP